MSDLLFSSEILPPFSQIKTENIEKEINKIITKQKSNLDKILKHKDWDRFVLALEEDFIHLANAWSPVSHLNSVVSSKELRAAYEVTLEQIIQYNLFVEQNLEIFNTYKEIHDIFLNSNNSHKETLKLKLLANKIRDFKLAGVQLDAESKAKFTKIVTDLSSKTTKFSNNVLDCTDLWTYHITDESLLDGIPNDIIQLAKGRAQNDSKDGWLFGLDAPTYITILKYAKNQKIRSAFHYAYSTRASKKGPHDEKFDNTIEMYDILLLRYNKAKMLGFKNYAEYSLAPKMVENPQVVIDFLTSLVSKAKVMAEKEFNELRLFAKVKDKVDNLKPWDISYYSELQKQKLFDLSDEFLKEYFPLEKVLNGFFDILHRIYNISIVADKSIETWHEDVLCYAIKDQNEVIIGFVYLDLYARLHKRSGAWMDECRARCFTKNIKQISVSYLTCNFTQPAAGNEALLTHNDVVTLFHEFGHCLHHLLTKIDYPSLSGINGVPWDAVELPSQLHEYWAWLPESLPLISSHYKTGEPLPEKYLGQLSKQKNFHAGLFLIRQLIFALFDFKLHMNFHPDKGVSQIQDTINSIRSEVGVLPFAEYDQFQHSFTHIFAGGYAAGYYSYLWAEVLAANCFKKFQDNGVFDSDTGQEFLDKILSQGGSIDFNEATTDFCGSPVKIEPLLDKYGIKY